MERISWKDSCGNPSLIHLTSDGKDTVCGSHSEYISNRELIKAPRKIRGLNNHCEMCFVYGKKSLPWDARCLDVKEEN